MEEVTRLLSSGDCVKLWDSVSMMVVDQFNPHSPSHPVTQVCWSSNNQYVASASSSGDKLVLSSIKSSAVPVVVLAEGKKQTRVCLSSSSQYLLSGGLDHTVNIWDLKNRRLHRCLKVHSEEVTSVSFNNNDTYIASGSTSGDIILHSMTTDMTSKAFGHGNTQPVRDLRLSQLKRSLLGSVSDSGTVVLWDSNTQKELHSFHSAHKAPASGLAFSPVSDLLFVTVGLDKKIICYDTGSKIVLRSLRVDCPVTAVDFTPDGTGVVVGTTQGKIYHYDLRNSSAPTRTTAAHRTSVTSLRYQTTNAKANKSNKGMSSKVSNIKRVSIKSGPTVSAVTTPASPLSPTPSLRDTDVFNREAEGQLEAAELLSSLDSKFSSVGRNSLDMFSPARDVTSIPEVLPRDTKSQPLRGRASLDVFSPVGDGNKNVWVSEAMEGLPRDTEGQPIRGRASLDVFSPLRDDTSYSSTQRRTPLGTPLVNPSRAFSPLSIFQTPPIREEELLSPTSPPERIGGANLEEEEPTTPPTQTNHLKSVPSFFTPDLSSRTNGIQTFHGTTPTPTAAAASASAFASSLSEKIAEVVGGGGGGGGAEGGGGAPFSTLQIHFIKNMIQDTLEDFRDACHRDVVNLQVEMVKQFYIQLNEIHGLIERYSVNDTLVEEIERLKEENKKLRTNY